MRDCGCQTCIQIRALGVVRALSAIRARQMVFPNQQASESSGERLGPGKKPRSGVSHRATASSGMSHAQTGVLYVRIASNGSQRCETSSYIPSHRAVSRPPERPLLCCQQCAKSSSGGDGYLLGDNDGLQRLESYGGADGRLFDATWLCVGSAEVLRPHGLRDGTRSAEGRKLRHGY